MTATFIFLSWFFAFLLAFIPLSPSLEYIFADRVTLRNAAFFEHILVRLDSAKSWAEKLLTYDPNIALASHDVIPKIRSSHSWQDLRNAIGNTSSITFIEPTRYFG